MDTTSIISDRKLNGWGEWRRKMKQVTGVLSAKLKAMGAVEGLCSNLSDIW